MSSVLVYFDMRTNYKRKYRNYRNISCILVDLNGLDALDALGSKIWSSKSDCTLLWVKTRKVRRCPRQRIHDVVPSHGPSSEFFRQRQCRELGSFGSFGRSAASDLGNSEPALEASGLNTGLRYKVCASSLDHNGQERPRRWANKRVSSVKVSWCVQCCCGDQIWKSRISLGGPGWSRPSCAPHGNVFVESWWLWGAKPAGYSLFDIYVSGVVSASCLGIWRNFHFVANRKNQAGTYSERCPPFRSFRHLQCVHHLMCPPRDRWVLNHVIMSHHVSSCHLEYLKPIRCKRLCWSACQKNAQRLKKVFTDSRWFHSLLMIGVHFKERMFQASTAFLAAGQLFFEDHVYCLLSFVMHVYSTQSTDTSRYMVSV